MLAALEDPSEDVQRAAVAWIAAKKVDDPRVAAKLGDFLTRPVWKDRSTALRALAATGTNRLIHIEKVIWFIDDADPLLRRHAVLMLGQIRPVERIPYQLT